VKVDRDLHIEFRLLPPYSPFIDPIKFAVSVMGPHRSRYATTVFRSAFVVQTSEYRKILLALDRSREVMPAKDASSSAAVRKGGPTRSWFQQRMHLQIHVISEVHLFHILLSVCQASEQRLRGFDAPMNIPVALLNIKRYVLVLFAPRIHATSEFLT
jgi:hypothetical protein